ncbi:MULTISPECIES: DUF397 domain-containing protein [unclassified Nocardiopsis]|uniref:DUF397 domain-containing protein n=1 Tax=unclassified Nocardiopsis TaxID=2649073 RepID=UPI00135CDF46
MGTRDSVESATGVRPPHSGDANPPQDSDHRVQKAVTAPSTTTNASFAPACWHKASYTNGRGACVEVSEGAATGVRDTENREAGALFFSGEAGEAFLGHRQGRSRLEHVPCPLRTGGQGNPSPGTPTNSPHAPGRAVTCYVRSP